MTFERDDAAATPAPSSSSAWLNRVFADHYLGLVRFAVQFVDDQNSAEDVVQDVFAAMSAGKQQPEDPLRFLRTAVINRSRSLLRRRKTARLFVPGRLRHAESADEQTLRGDRQTTVLAAVAQLPQRQREVVILRYYEDLSVTEIAALLGIKPGAVSASLTRAMHTLDTLLERHDAK